MMQEQRGVYRPSEDLERTNVSPDAQYFGRPRDLSETRRNLAEVLEGDKVQVHELLEALPAGALQALLTQRTDADVEQVSTAIELAVEGVLDKSIVEASPAEIDALLRSGALPDSMLAQYANFQYHRGQYDRARIMAHALVHSDHTSDMMVANQYNLLGVLADRVGDKAAVRAMNEQGLEALEGKEGVNILWQQMKIEHGLARGDIRKLQVILEARREIGDSAHVGRTHLDIARAYRDQEEADGAYVHYREAYEDLVNAGYIAKAKDAERELADLVDARTAVHVVPEMPGGEREKRFDGYTMPASCLLKVGDQYLVTYDAAADVHRPLLVDQTRKKNAEKEIRSRISQLLNQLYPEVDPDVISQMKEPVGLSKRAAKVVPTLGKREILPDQREHWMYTVSLASSTHDLFDQLAALPLDKQQEVGYVIMSFEDLQGLDSADDTLTSLIENEDRFLTTQT